MKIRIVGERVLILESKRSAKYGKGIIEVPYDYQRKSSSGEILQLGNPKVAETYGIRVGDTALFHRYAGASLISDDHEESEYRFVNPDQVLAVIRNNELLVLGDRVLVSDMGPEKQKGAIVLPDKHREDIRKGTLCSTGSKCSVSLSSGNTVMYSPNSGVEHDIEGKKYRILDTEAIIGIIEG